MSIFFKFSKTNPNKFLTNNAAVPLLLQHKNVQTESSQSVEEFKPLNLKHVRGQVVLKKRFKKADVPPPRMKQMPLNQEWGNVWPGPRTFHPATVPFPLHQGYVQKGFAPDKYANLELMKIPNFLHLTPPVIKRQCEALKKFCTAWPKELESDEECEKHFPLNVICSTYCHSSPTIRDPLARIVSVKIKLSNLELDKHAKDKLLRLVGDRYSEETDTLTIVTDRCPTSKQNYDYAMFLLTALYYESWKIEEWESTKSEADMEYYNWDTAVSCKNLEDLWVWNTKSELNKNDVQVQKYKEVVNKLWNEGENVTMLNEYNKIVRELLNVPPS